MPETWGWKDWVVLEVENDIFAKRKSVGGNESHAIALARRDHHNVMTAHGHGVRLFIPTRVS